MAQPNLVLLIDDDKTFNFINEKVIRISSFAQNIKTFLSAASALNELKSTVNKPEEFPSVIFLDINMPNMDGWEFLEELKKFPDYILNQCKVFMLTSSIDESDIEKSKTYAVVTDFIPKPLTTEKLSSVTGLLRKD